MAYQISAFVAQIPVLEWIKSRNQPAAVIPLSQGFGLIPITTALRDETQSNTFHRLYSFTALSGVIAEIAMNASQFGTIAYIEAEIFGGVGTQGAIVWRSGKVAFEPLVSEETRVINRVLHELGVEIGSAHDEFDALGLGKYRSTDAWLKEIET